MKVTVRVNEFKRVLEEARFVVPKKTKTRVLAFVKVEVDSNKRATISAADLGLSITQTFEVVDGDAGAFLLHPKKMQDFIKNQTGGTATIEVDDRHTVVKAGTFSMKVETLPVREFPNLEAMPESKHPISLKFLKRLVTQVESACPDKPGRMSVAFVELVSDGKKLRAVASDGARLAIADVTGDFGVFKFQIPKVVLPVLKRREGTKVGFAESETSHFFRTEGVVLQYNKPVTKFPPYQKALAFEDKFAGTVKVGSADLKSAILNLSRTVVDLKNPGITFDVCAGSLKLSVSRNEAGSGSLEVETEGEPGTFKLNPNFVLDALSQMEGEVTIHFLNTESILVKISAGSNYRQLIMPLLTPGKKAAIREERPSSVST